jgi:peptidylprolyl isomerase
MSDVKTRVGALLLAGLFVVVTGATSVGVIITARQEKKKEKDAQALIENVKAKTDAPKGTAEAIPTTTKQPGDTKMQPKTPLPAVITSVTPVAELKIEDLVVGDGQEVKPGEYVTAFYHGTLLKDGKVFDSSYERGVPTPFPLTGVIQGWQKGVPGMKIGGQRRLTIPAALAYGANPPSASIPANADMVFVIEITKIGQ